MTLRISLRRRLAFVSAIMAASGCSSERTVEILNTSGAPRIVVVMGAKDNYLTDTLPAATTLCWKVPDVAYGEVVKVLAVPVYTIQMLEQRPVEGSWIDSLALSRSIRIQIHAPRFVEASAEWKARRLKKEKEVDAWFRSAMALASQGRSPATVDQLLALRESQLSGPMFEQGGPQVLVDATVSDAKTCEQ